MISTTHPTVRQLKIGMHNIRLVNSNIDNNGDLMWKHHLHVLVLTVTWHEDSNCSIVKNIRSFGYNLVEEARTIPSTTKCDIMLFVSHGDITIISKPGTKVSIVNLKVMVFSFKHFCGRVTLELFRRYSSSSTDVILNKSRPNLSTVLQHC